MANEKNINKPAAVSVTVWLVVLLYSLVLPFNLICLLLSDIRHFPPKISDIGLLDISFMFWFYGLLAFVLIVSALLSASSWPPFKIRRWATYTGRVLSWLGLAVLAASAIFWSIKLDVELFKESGAGEIFLISLGPVTGYTVLALPLFLLVYYFRYATGRPEKGGFAWMDEAPRIFKITIGVYMVSLSLFCLLFATYIYFHFLYTPDPYMFTGHVLLLPYSREPYNLLPRYINLKPETYSYILIGFSVTGILSGIYYLRSRSWARHMLQIVSLIALSFILLTVLFWFYLTFFSHKPRHPYYEYEIYQQSIAILYLLCFLVEPLVIVFRFLLRNDNRHLHRQQRMSTTEQGPINNI